MFDNIAFDVVIGLVLVYLLYSLLVTIAGEMIATWTGLRARVLRLEIEKMLNDGYYSEQGALKQPGLWSWHFIQRFFLKEFEDFKYSFAGKFYEQPSIKYLSNKAGETKSYFTNTKPSYFTADNFADTLTQLLKEKGSGATDIEKIEFCLKFNTHHIQPESLKNMQRIFKDSENDITLFKGKLKAWFSETNDRATGWYKSKLRLILFWFGFIVAVIFNVDTIQIAKILSTDKEARNQLVAMGVEIAKDTLRYKDFTDANGEPYSKAILDSGLSNINKDIGNANQILGLGWHLSAKQKNTSGEFKAGASGTEKSKNLLIGIMLSYSIAETYRDSMRLGSNDSVRQEFKKKLAANNKQSASFLKELNHLLGADFTSINSFKTDPSAGTAVLTINGKTKFNRWNKASYFLLHITPLKASFYGFIITALMLSLGAPFWFDLLKKLVALRGSGVKPEEKKVESSPDTAPASVYNKVVKPGVVPAKEEIPGDLTDHVLSVYGPLIKGIAGVKTIFKKNDSVTNRSSIQVNVINKLTEEILRKKYPLLTTDDGEAGYSIVVSGTPETHQAEFGPISNASNKNGSGSLGCILKDKLTGQKHILSCWHVLKGNTDYDTDDNDTTIIDSENNRFAERWAGGIDGTVDFGLAECFSGRADTNKNLLKKMGFESFDHRQLSSRDINKQIPVKYYDCLSDKVRVGKIYAHTPVVEIHYLDKVRDVEDVLILTNDSAGTDRSISEPGNSGSFIFDEKGFAIAMVIAGDFNYTYAIKLSNIFLLHKEMEILKT